MFRIMRNQSHSYTPNQDIPVKTARLPVWGIVLVALGFPTLVAAIGALWVAYQAPIYGAEAKVLIMSPAEQYMPDQGLSPIAAHIQDPAAIQSDARSLLFDSAQNQGQTPLATYQPYASFHYDSALHTLTFALNHPMPETAMAGANQLAQFYIVRLKERRRTAFATAIQKLEDDIQLILQQKERLIANGKQQETHNSHEKAAAQKSIKATDRILTNMRALHQQALTKQKYDLLPPEARILVRATLPDKPKDPGLIITVCALFLVSFVIVAVWLATGQIRHKKAMAKRRCGLPELPVSAGFSEPKTDHWHPILKDAPEEQVSFTKINGAEFEDNLRETFDFAHLVQQIIQTGFSRLVLMSETPDWNDLNDALVGALMEQDLAVLLLEIGHGDVDRGAVGISDLIDGKARYADLVQVNLKSGLHHITSGRRSLRDEDFTSGALHSLLHALDQACDLVVIDMGLYCDNEYALQAMSLAENAVACLHAPQADAEIAQEVRDVLAHFGYLSSIIVPLDCIFDGLTQPTGVIAAE